MGTVTIGIMRRSPRLAVMTIVAPVGAPSRRDAERAAAALAQAGVAQVLLYGSLARGAPHAASDIDLVAVFDDLDYTQRWHLKSRLDVLATGAARRPVEVRVTDRPEWQHRTRRLRTSFERGIAAEAVVLYDTPPGPVDWHKEIGMATSDLGEAANSMGNTNKALRSLHTQLEPGPPERYALADRDPDSYLDAIRDRLCDVCAFAQSALENSLKALVHRYGAEPPGRVHSLADLLDQLPATVRRAAAAPLEGFNLESVSRWRQPGTYPGDFAERTLAELTTESHDLATAACALARLAADRLTTRPDPQQPNLRTPSAAEADQQAARADTLATRIAHHLGANPARATPTEQMNIPPPPEPPHPEPGHGDRT